MFLFVTLEIGTKKVPHKDPYLLPKCNDWIYPDALLSCLSAYLQMTISSHCEVEDQARHCS